ncbi:hypothetical protein PAMA_004367 [Pampus argenteus]
MKTKWHLYILWSVLSLDLLGCSTDTYESTPAVRRKKIVKLGPPKFEPDATKPSTTDNKRKPSPRLFASTFPSSQTRAQTSPVRPGEAKIGSDFAYLPDVSVTCSTSDFVVRVKAAFYGLGADASELNLGSSCKSNGVLRPYGDLLFTYPLTSCDSQRELLHGYLVYKFVLHYEPSPVRFPSRAHRVDVDIECYYQSCMVDSKREPGASQFISRTDKTQRFSLKAFQFISHPSTEPHAAEDGFLLVTSSLVTVRSADNNTMSRVNLWENADVPKYDSNQEEQGYVEEEKDLEDDDEVNGRRPILGGMTEPELEKNVFRERVLVEDKKMSEEEDSSGFKEDFLESGEEERFVGGEDKKLVHLSHQKEGEVLNNWAQFEQMLRSHVGLQRKVQPLNSESEAERRRSSEVERRNHDDDGQQTWYFTWR